MKYYVVIDTNVIVSALMEKQNDSNTVKVLKLFFAGNIIPLYSDEVLEEYKEVLSRPAFMINKNKIGKFINVLRTNGIYIEPQKLDVEMKDDDDIVFYELVMDKTITSNKYLITGNIKDYIINPIIVTPDEFIKIVENKK